MFGNHGLGGLLEEGAHEKSPKCLGGNLGDFGEFCKGLSLSYFCSSVVVVVLAFLAAASARRASCFSMASLIPG